MMSTSVSIDETAVQEFAERAVSHFSGALTVALCYLGDRLGLFTTLNGQGPMAPQQFAAQAGIDERYAAEWLRALAAQGYLECDRKTGRYGLSQEHAVVLAEEGSPGFLGHAYNAFPALVGQTGRLLEAFRNGGGLSMDEYPDDLWAGIERSSGVWSGNSLLQEWIPAMPVVQEKLEAGCEYADVGCGAGRALINLARAYPRSRFTGYDLFPGQVDRARASLEAHGLADRIRVEVADAAEGLPQTYDVVSTYDVVHDAADPLRLLKGIRSALKRDGVYVCMDFNCADRHEENEGPIAAMLYGFSIFYCMTTSLANGGAGLGTCGLPEATCRELCERAGFSKVRRVPIENSFNSLYEVCA